MAKWCTKSTARLKRTAQAFQQRVVFWTLLALAIALSILCHANGQSAITTSSVTGTVIVLDAGVAFSVPGAKVELKGSETLETETDETGTYCFKNVEPGEYIIEASVPGMHARQNVVAERAAVVKATLEIEPVVVETTVTVSGASQNIENSPGAVTISEKTIIDAPNASERFESLLPLVPGVVRGPDGRINMKGTRNTQSGALVNSANVTDPASGGPAINLPIDVVSSVRVISNPYDPQYGKLTGALSMAETKTGNYKKFHFTVQNVLPRLRDRDGTIAGIGAATPRMTFTGPLIKDRLALIQSFEYRFVRTPVNSLPPSERDTKLEGFNCYTQLDLIPGSRQTATVSLAIYPQELDYMGLNTFTPQPSTSDFHQRGHQIYAQHRYVTGPDSILTSQFSYKTYDVDIKPQSYEPYRLLIDTTAGGFFNQQSRRTTRYDTQESYQFGSRQFYGAHHISAGVGYSHSGLNGTEAFFPVQLIGPTQIEIEQIRFAPAASFHIDQSETAAYVYDQWAPSSRVFFGLGLRFDSDTVTSSMHLAPRGSVLFTLTGDGRTLLRGGAGIFYDRVPLILPIFAELPERKVSMYDSSGQVSSSVTFVNRIDGGLHNPRSTAWNIELERQFTNKFTTRVGYEQRNTARDFVVSPLAGMQSNVISLSNRGGDSYGEFQVTGRYQASRFTANASYVRSRAYGHLNDPFLFVGNYPQAVIQADAKARLLFDAPNRLLISSDVAAPLKLTISPVCDLHTGFPYSVENEYRDYLGARNVRRFPRFSSCDLQVTRPVSMHTGEKRLKTRVGVSVFNAFNHFNPRDVQNMIDSENFGGFYNDAWREYRGKLVFEF